MNDNYYQPRGSRQTAPYSQPQVISVSSREEALASPADFFCPKIMLGLNHGAIYVKRFDPETAQTIFQTFQLIPEPEPTRYVTMEMFDELKALVLQQRQSQEVTADA